MAVQKVIEGVTTLFQSHLSTLRDQVFRKLAEAGIETNAIPGLGDLFELKEHSHPFLGLETKHQQLSFFRKHLNFIVSLILLQEFLATLLHTSYRTQYA